jgi:pyruvate/2-oxoglutarate dehydrogenase complex dihydrolipoamide dehydrogenase (E3) component
MDRLPKSIAIVGGGYIAAKYGPSFQAWDQRSH